MITVFIPAYNEQEVLEHSALKVHQYFVDRQMAHEVIIVSNGSTDNTNSIGQRLAKEHDWFRFFSLNERCVGGAFCLAVREAKFEYLVALDADLSFDLVFIDYAAHLLDYADMLVGSKTMGQQRRGLLRVFASQMYILSAQYLLNLTVSDYSIGCKAYRRQSILPLLDGLDQWTGYVIELVLKLQGQGAKVVQVSIDCDDRRTSHFNLLHEGIYRYWHLVKVWKRTKSGRLD